MITQKKTNRPLYHEFEFSICGYSGSGKTTLLEKLLKKFSEKYTVGFVKSDVHSFEMDKEGKDTQKLWKAGATGVHIFDKTHTATIAQGESDLLQKRQLFYDKDFVLIEGHKQSKMPKAVMIDPEMKIRELLTEDQLQQVELLIGPWDKNPFNNLEIAYIQRDQVDAIGDFILNSFQEKIRKKPIYGLVLSGGKSQRMKKDKAILSYNGKPQLLRAAELLEPLCDKVFLSYREGQDQRQQFESYPSILDRFVDFGPMGGILSAQSKYENATWVVLACDLPYLDEDSLKYLLQKRDPFKIATAFESVHDGFPEPLCAVYESRSKLQLLNYLGLGYQCPRKVLINSRAHIIKAQNHRALDNVNHPHEYQSALKDMGVQEAGL